jgi:hypothetical protein
MVPSSGHAGPGDCGEAAGFTTDKVIVRQTPALAAVDTAAKKQVVRT